jgi:DNA mismatch repair ATPase MutL
MNQTRSEEPKPPRANFHQLLKMKREMLEATKKDIAKQAAIRKNDLDTCLNIALGDRRNAISRLRKQAEEEKVPHKTAHDSARLAALKKYDESLIAITAERDLALVSLHKAKEAAYHRINEELDKKELPIVERHKAAIKELTEKYEKNELLQMLAAEKVIAALLEDIKDVEGEIAARRPALRSQPAPTAAP